MKLLRILFGRFFIVALLVLLQIAFFVTSVLYLDKVTPYYYYIQLGFSVIGVFLVLVLMNRQVNPNYIVPWIVILLVMPILGVVAYMMFSQNKLRHGQKKFYCKAFDCTVDYVPQNNDVMERLKQKDELIATQSQYLLKANRLPVYDNTYCKYFPTGESFFVALKEELQKAEHFIFLEYFIIEEGMMWNSILDILVEKVNSGVEVRVMYDDIGTISKLRGGYYKKLRKMGIKCEKFNKFFPIVSAVHNNRDHRKMAIIDGKVGFMGGANLADEYINVIKKHGYWKDSQIMLKGEAVKSMTVMFLQMYNAQTKITEKFDKYFPQFEVVGKNLGFIQPFGDGPMPLYTEKVAQTAILNMINHAKRYIYITTPYLIVDFQLMDAMKRAAKRGVDIRIVTPHIPDKRIIFMMTRSSYSTLIEAGVKIYEYSPGFMHSKNFLVDDKVAIVGTINMDYRSLVHHFECAVWMYDTPCISEIKQDLNKTFAISHEVTTKESRLNPIQKLIRLVLELFAPLL